MENEVTKETVNMMYDISDDYLDDDDLYELFKDEKETYTNDAFRQYYSDLSRFKLLTREEEHKYFTEYAKTKDEKLRDFLINSNLRLVVYCAFRAINFCPKTLDVLDLIQAGNIGLMSALEKYDATKGYRFATYATWHINSTIFRSIDNTAETIRIPTHIMTKHRSITKFERNYEMKNGRKPSKDEYEKKFEMPYSEIEKIINLPKTLKDISTVIVTQNMSDENAEQPEVDLLMNTIVDSRDEVSKIETKIDFEGLWDKIENTLSDREYEIVLLRVGKQLKNVDSEDSKTLEEVATIQGVSRERVRQIEQRAYKKIKSLYLKNN